MILTFVAFYSLLLLWGNVRHFIPRLRFFFFKWNLTGAHLFHSLGQDQSPVAQRAETTVTECSLTSCVWTRFLTGPTLCLDSGIVSPFGLYWVKGVCLFGCNLSAALLADWPGSFTCHCGNTGMERTLNKSQHTKLTLEKKILPPHNSFNWCWNCCVLWADWLKAE